MPVAAVSVWVWTGACSSSGMLASICRLSPDLVESGTNQPQNRVNHKKSKDADQQQVHEQAHIEESRIHLAIMCIGVWLILDKADIRSGVALSAGRDQVGLVDGGTRIGCRIDLVRPVAVPATRSLHVSAQRAKLRVEGVAIRRKLFLVARSADRG